jgi:hypothetical protein
VKSGVTPARGLEATLADLDFAFFWLFSIKKAKMVDNAQIGLLYCVQVVEQLASYSVGRLKREFRFGRRILKRETPVCPTLFRHTVERF